MSDPESIHVPVLPEEVLYWLQPLAGQTIVDGTLGGGGHTRLLAERVGPEGCVIALDRDPRVVRSAKAQLASWPVRPIQADFRNITGVLRDLQVPLADGMLLDLGLSSDQLADGERGFSFQANGPLDLRFDPTTGEPAWRLLERLSPERIADIIFRYGEERFSRRIARKIVEQRRRRPLRTSAELADLVRACVPRSRGHSIDPATRTFQALRIAVNDELQALAEFLRDAPVVLREGGRLAIISFHSLEDRTVKHAFRGDPRYVILTKKPIRPNEAELRRNPRCRSAKMRVSERAPVSEV